ncbi:MULTISPECIES: SDR family NAD(P)-dependent oxidoreductase [unclassified Streptomyces]|jgi:NAD(P)-dependent dehydrogenase (short-subunit alcohol dehydrogenase family)|uniref:SDR family NAD(P)-dependent oxidoreductase n=1 Tax=unclassified Streptomyces TaxID=2593676 RepID=UPI0008EF3FF7|nr:MULTISPECIES: SDR family oxidoreductase [unclassified Streptomyces]MDX2733110.1 SDR family oxidoreductase [Streptomyces sp. PA03-2a]MDX3770225.1 SDR family oxidoreductase [Streptomyces sp. AK08-01B]MDX3819496.1 SDR family oxidoreductase [Streptomyces sp. AK08-01A]SFT31240.1 NAD(P)-dependent dehydrogenase, short-chain alcohol dehydrogenase family [Streptomyces sp. ok210]
MNKPLTGKVALVTGGSRGLGAATVRLLAEQGADVAFTYVSSEQRARAVVDEVQAKGAKALAVKSDQADMGGAPALIDEVVAHFGGLDILVNNAAVSPEQGRTVDDPDVDTAALDRMHATNYLGVIAVIRAASRVLREGGRIVTVSSGLGTRVGLPGLADYSATKSGIERYTMGVARDLGRRGITANVVEAGLMESGMEPPDPETLKALVGSLSLQRMGHPDEIAAAIGFLAGPSASYITGAVLDAHGGYNA